MMGDEHALDRAKASEEHYKAEMLKAFHPLPTLIRSEIKLRVALMGFDRRAPDMTDEGMFMKKCAEVARLFVLDLDK